MASPDSIRPVDIQAGPVIPKIPSGLNNKVDLDLSHEGPTSLMVEDHAEHIKSESSDAISKAVNEIPVPKHTSSYDSSHGKFKLPPIPSFAPKHDNTHDEPVAEEKEHHEQAEDHEDHEDQQDNSAKKEELESSLPSEAPHAPSLVLGRVIEDYNPESSGELTLIVGDVITILEEREDTWKGEKNGIKGYFPSNVIIFTILNGFILTETNYKLGC